MSSFANAHLRDRLEAAALELDLAPVGVVVLEAAPDRLPCGCPMPGSARRTMRPVVAGDPELGYIVTVRAGGRPWCAVVADVVDGLLAANALPASTPSPTRTRLLVAALELDRT